MKRLSTLVGAVSPERYLFDGAPVRARARRRPTGPTVFGTTPDYCLANNHFVQDGRFITDADLNHASQVAVIGTDVADALFPHRDPIDQAHHHRRPRLPR